MRRETEVIGGLVVLAIVVAAAIWSRGAGWGDRVSRDKLAELAKLPVGIRVIHSPNPARAQRGGRSGMKYTWLYETQVSAIEDEVTITEFGAFTRVGERWVFSTIYQRPFNAAEFAEWYSCPGARLAVGETFSDPCNYTGSDELCATKAKWYFIGANSKGEKVKGESVIDRLAEVGD